MHRNFRPSWFNSGAATLAMAVFLALGVFRAAGATSPGELAGKVGFDQRLGAEVPRALPFLDDRGRTVRLGDLLDGRRPAILVLGYYECPMLCWAVLNGLTESRT